MAGAVYRNVYGKGISCIAGATNADLVIPGPGILIRKTITSGCIVSNGYPENMYIDHLNINIAGTRQELGQRAAAAVAERVRSMLLYKPLVNIVFAAAPSQDAFLENLLRHPLEWSRIRAFHMDEYIGLEEEAPQRFGNYLKERLFGKRDFSAVHYLDGAVAGVQGECDRYAGLLQNYPPDIVCMGIGENNHIAFNDPPVADFRDPRLVKVVELDQDCRRQQVNDGCFQTITAVPARALTLTIPALMQAEAVFCMVPGASKAWAVYHTLTQPVQEQYPSTILRNHADAILFLDAESSALVAGRILPGASS